MKFTLLRALVCLLVACPLVAQPGPGPGLRQQRIAQALHLTDAQKTSIKAIHDKHQASLLGRREATRQAQTALIAALREAATPEAQLRTLHDKAAAARFDMILARRSVRQEVQAVLTPEQRAKATELRDTIQARVRERMHRLGRAGGMAD